MGTRYQERVCLYGMVGEEGCEEETYKSEYCNQDVQCRKFQKVKSDSDRNFQHLGELGARGQIAAKSRKILLSTHELENAQVVSSELPENAPPKEPNKKLRVIWSSASTHKSETNSGNCLVNCLVNFTSD